MYYLALSPGSPIFSMRCEKRSGSLGTRLHITCMVGKFRLEKTCASSSLWKLYVYDYTEDAMTSDCLIIFFEHSCTLYTTHVLLSFNFPAVLHLLVVIIILYWLLMHDSYMSHCHNYYCCHLHICTFAHTISGRLVSILTLSTSSSGSYTCLLDRTIGKDDGQWTADLNHCCAVCNNY